MLMPFPLRCMALFVGFALAARPAVAAAPDSLIDVDALAARLAPTAQKSPEGFYYHLERPGTGRPKAGDFAMLHFVGKLPNGEVFDASDPDEPFVFELGQRQVIAGWELGLPFFGVGSKGLLILPPNLAYGSKGAGKVPGNSPVYFEIELIKLLNFEEYDAYMAELDERHRREFEAEQEEVFKRDKLAVAEYGNANGLRTKMLRPSGVAYAIAKEGKGPMAKPGDQLTVHYEGRLLDGTVFASSKGKAPFSFVLGKGKVIEGWELAFPFFNKGSEGWIIIPSRYAYGAREIKEEDLHIPSNAVLVFKVEVLNIVPGQ